MRAGGQQEKIVLPTLAVYKPYHGKRVRIEFDHDNAAIFNLIVSGGEVISWK